MITCKKDSLGGGGGGRIQFIFDFFFNFPLFSEIFIRIDEYANKITNLHIRPFHQMKVLYLNFNLLAS